MRQVVTDQFSGVELYEAGRGRPVLFLHGGDYFLEHLDWLTMVSHRHRVLAPRHPGFGRSDLPDDFRSVGDLAYHYLDFLDRLNLQDVLLVGSSFGGWIALEMCVRSTERVCSLMLLNSIGVKFGDREHRDIADIYALPEEELLRRMFFDPPAWNREFASMPDEEVAIVVRDRTSTALFGWRPYMHNPELRKWLRRIQIPALVVWGAHDAIVPPAYGRALAAALPRSSFHSVPRAAHFPQLEQSDEVLRLLEAFEADVGPVREKTIQ